MDMYTHDWAGLYGPVECFCGIDTEGEAERSIFRQRFRYTGSEILHAVGWVLMLFGGQTESAD